MNQEPRRIYQDVDWATEGGREYPSFGVQDFQIEVYILQTPCLISSNTMKGCVKAFFVTSRNP